MHKCTDGYIFINDKEMSWNEPYWGWRRINISYCPICGFAMQPDRSKREDSVVSNYNFITGNADY